MGVAGLMVAVSVAVLAPRMFPSDPVVLSVVEQASDLRAEAALLVEQIEAFRRERGTLPDAPMLAPYLDSGYEYRIIDRSLGKYEVRRSAGGVVVTYDGSLPLGLWVVIGGSTGGGGA